MRCVLSRTITAFNRGSPMTNASCPAPLVPTMPGSGTGTGGSAASPGTTPVPLSLGTPIPALRLIPVTPDTWATFISFATISARLTIGALPPEALLAISST